MMWGSTMRSFLLLIGIASVRGGIPRSDNVEQLARSVAGDGGSAATVENLLAVREILKEYAQRYTPTAGKDLVQNLALAIGPQKTDSNDINTINKEFVDFMYQGDIVLSVDQAHSLLGDGLGKGVNPDPKVHWDPATPINYFLDSTLAASAIPVIRKGIEFWQNNTCLSFTENANGKNALQFTSGGGCWSYIGKQATWPKQEVSIGNGCDNLGTVTHEIGHALGFYHTQSRWDRDQYVDINFANIQKSLQYNFDKMTQSTDENFNITYDFGSVMQYNAYAFAIDYNTPTVVAKDPNFQSIMGQRVGPSFSDVKMMNLNYKCPSKCATPLSCQHKGYMDSRNCGQCKCPSAFGGPTCGELAKGTAQVCTGAVLTATDGWQTVNGSAGYPQYTQSKTPFDCYWHITAPAGRKVQMKLRTAPSICQDGCGWQAIEVNLGNFDIAGMQWCCQTAAGTVYNSVDNIITVKATSRYQMTTFAIDYKLL